MREYVLNTARSRSSAYGLGRLWFYISNWCARRNLLKLHLLDDHQLKDIGLTRGEVAHLARLPLSVDVVWEAERLRLIASRQRLNSTGNR